MSYIILNYLLGKSKHKGDKDVNPEEYCVKYQSQPYTAKRENPEEDLLDEVSSVEEDEVQEIEIRRK